jgi:CheY-like chemotaxis protein
VGGIVHDFNNLLTAVTGYSQLLLKNEGLDEQAKRDLEQILGAAKRAAALTQQLLAFSRKQTLELQILSLNDVVEGLTKMLGRLVRADIELVTTLAPDLWNLKADRAQLEQVLMNLVVNASDAMPGGGTLTIATETMTLDERYAEMHLEVEPGRYVLLTVSDTGIGMDRKTASRVFEPFFTTKKEKGTGLGLSTVYGIVKQHGGYIWVYSEPGQGTTFKIYLPPARGAEERATAAPDVIEDLHGTETVLLVDNDEQIREPVRRTLEALGYTVLEAARPEEALQLATAHDGEIHLLLTDVVMPRMSGDELAERFASIFPRSAALLMSGHIDDTPTLRVALQPGAAFLRKPFTATDLARKVREVLDAGAGGAGEVLSPE